MCITNKQTNKQTYFPSVNMTIENTTKLKKKLISQAIEVLRETKIPTEESGKKALFEDDSSTLFLQVLFKKIPERSGAQMIKVILPHSLIKDTDEVCLITGDTNKKDRKAETEPDVLHYKDILYKHGVTQVSKIVTLRQLRTDYKSYADKQKLLAAYDAFLADNKIYECLPKLLGKFFYKKRKFPHKINMKSPNLKEQIEKALSIKRFYVTGNGNCCCSDVASLCMSNSEIIANVVEMVSIVSKEMPGKWENIKGIYLKTARSPSIPLYMSYGNPNEVILPKEEDNDDVIIDELTTKPNVSVKVHKDGRVELFTSKNSQEVRLHEISKDVQIKDSESQEKNKRKQTCDQKEMIKSGKKRVQQNIDDGGNESVTILCQKSKQEKNILDEDICNADEESSNIVVKGIKHKDSKKKLKKEKKNVFEDSYETDLMKDSCISIKGEKHADLTKKSKKGKKNVLEDSCETPLITDSCISIKGEKHGDLTKKSKKGKKNVIDDSCQTALKTGDLSEKEKKSAYKRKRELSESEPKEKAFLSFESPKQNKKKRKVDTKNLKKQPFKDSRKKTLQQKTKKNFKA